MAALLACDAAALSGTLLSESSHRFADVATDWSRWPEWLAAAAGQSAPVRLERCALGPDRRLEVVVYPAGDEEVAVLVGDASGSGATPGPASGWSEAERRSEERYRTLMTMLPDAVVLSDADDGRIVEANDAAARMYGYTRGQMLTMCNADLSAEPDATMQAMRAGLHSIPLRLHRKRDGTVFPVEVSARRVLWQGRPMHMAVLRDIGERRGMEASLSAALAEAQGHRLQAEALLAGARDLLREDDFATAARVLFSHCREAVGAPVGYVALREGDSEREVATYPEGPSAVVSVVLGRTRPLRGLRKRAYASGSAVWDNDFRASPSAGVLPAGHPSLDSILLVPLMVHGRAEGAMGFATKPGGFSEGDARTATAFAELLGVSLSTSRTHAALRESEERFRAYVSSAPLGIVVLDEARRCVEANPAACEMTGHSVDEFLTLSLRDIVAPSFGAEADRQLSDLERQGHTEGELRVVRRDGSELWVAVGSVLLPGDRILVFASDVGERRRAEEALRESEEKLRSMIEQSLEGFAMTDSAGTVVEWNAAQERVTGIPREEAIGQPMWEVQHRVAIPERREPALLQQLRQGITQAVQTGEFPATWSTLSERQIVWPTGERRTMQSSVFPIRTGRGYLLGSISRDVTDQVRAEQALRESQAKFSTAFQANAAMMVIASIVDGRIIEANQAFLDTLGYSPEEVLGKTSTELGMFPIEEQRDCLTAEFRRVGYLRNREVQVRTRDGRLCETVLSASSMDIAGEPCWLAFLLDITELKRAETALRESEARFRSLMEQSPDGITVTAQDGTVLEWNQAESEITGVPREEAVGRPIWEVMHRLVAHPNASTSTEQLRHHASAMMSAALAGETPGRRHDVELRRRDGEVRMIHAVSFPMVSIHGALTGNINRDVTASRRAEQALRESELKYRIVADNTYSWEFWLAPDGRFIYSSPTCERITGYTAAEFEADPDLLLKLVHPGDSGLYEKHARAETVEESSGPVVLRIVRRDGTECWLEHLCQRVYGQDGEYLGRRGSNRDITKRYRAEEALRRRATQSERLLQTARQLTTSLDLKQVLQTVAEQAHELLQADSCTLYLLEADGRLLRPVVATHPFYENRIMATPADVEVSLTGQAVRQRRALVFNDPSLDGLGQHLEGTPEHEAERIVVAPFIANERVVGAMRVDRSGAPFDDQDLTLAETFAAYAAAALKNAQAHERLQQEMRDRKQAEEALLQSQKMESVGRLAGGVAHDFNNILTAITGFSEFVLDQLEPNASAREDVQEVLRNAERATNLTRQLLAFSRRQAMEMRPVDLNALVSDLGKLLGRLIGEQIELVLDLDGVLALVNADAAQLEQVLLNLAVNGRDAMPHGGRLTVRTRSIPRQARPDDPGLTLPEGDCVCLEVTDTGTGISEEVMAHIFEPFYTTKGLGKGTGLGLATVYGIVKQHGGDIRVGSRPGDGSTFSVYLPALPPLTPVQPTADAPASLPGRGATILLVEDEEVVRAVARRYLERLGYTVLEAEDGLAALELASGADVQPALLITDLVMPRVGGLELARRLRADHPDLRVLYTSGYTDETRTLTDATDSGDLYLQKPFDARSLAQKVSEALGSR